MNGTFICSHCGGEHPMENHIIFNGQDLCQFCYESETVICERCGERIWTDDDCGDANHILCRDCADSCYDRHARGNTIQHYYYKPEPIFYGKGSRYLGVELEIDGGGETNEKASQILRVGNDLLEHIYIKHDGSLDEGLEIVTHPMTLDYHRG